MAPTRTLKDKQRSNGRTLALDSAAWRKLRALVLTEQPLCRDCESRGYIEPATEVDHHDNDASNNDRDNLVGLCKPCHSYKTQRHEHYKRTGQHLPLKGCDTSGMPLDPAHPWNCEKSPATDGAKPPGKPSFNANRRT
jgi:5-methylcytosine-specific restriction protein A